MLLIQIVFLAVLAFIGLREPVKKKQLREGIAFSVFFIAGATLLILPTLGINTPYPVDEINKFFMKTLHLSFD